MKLVLQERFEAESGSEALDQLTEVESLDEGSGAYQLLDIPRQDPPPYPVTHP